MENNEDLLAAEDELPITEETSNYLLDTSRWARFIAITIYVITGLAILIVLLYMIYITDRYGSMVTSSDFFSTYIIMMIIIGVVVGFTYYYLLNFANKTRVGIETESMENVNEGLRSLKTHMIIVGVILMLFIIFKLYQLSK